MPSFSDPTTALALVHQGWNQLQLQRPLAAWASWHRALRVEPESRAAREALEAWESAAELPAAAHTVYRFGGPRDEAHRARWDARLQGRVLDDLEAAAAAFASLADDDPGDAPAWYNHALCLAWLGRNPEAIAGLAHAVSGWVRDEFEHAVGAWTLAEVLRQGAGAEHLADDLRYAWVLDCNDVEAARLRAETPGLQALPVPRDPATGDRPFPAAQVFEWLDRPMPESASAAWTAADLPRVLATVVITPGSLRLSSPVAGTLEAIHAPLLRVLDDPARPIRREATPLPLALLDADIWTFRLPHGLESETERSLTRAAVEHAYEDLWIHRPRHGLEDRTPLETGRIAQAGDAVARAQLSAVVRFREQLGARPRMAALYQGYPFDRLRRRLGLEPEDPATVDPDDPTCMGAAELDRLDPTRLGADRLIDAYESAAGLRDDRRTARFAAELVRINAPGLTRVATPALFATLVREAMRANDPERALKWLDQARTTREGRDRRTYDTWAAEIHARTGDPDAAVRVYRTLLDASGPDPALALDAAETLLDNGYIDHADPLLRLARDLARSSGDRPTAARAEALLGRGGTDDPWNTIDKR